MGSRVICHILMDKEEKTLLDPASETIVKYEIIVGINRWHLQQNWHQFWKYLFLFYTIVSDLLVFAFVFHELKTVSLFIIIARIAFLLEYILCAVLSFTLSKSVQHFYCLLTSFDISVGCRLNRGCYPNRKVSFILLFVLLLNILIAMIWYTNLTPWLLLSLFVQYVFPSAAHLFEIYYFTYMLNLVRIKVKFILFSVKSLIMGRSLVMKDYDIINTERRQFMNLNYMMQMYGCVINIYDQLMDCFKWQVFIMVSTSFLRLLCVAYDILYDWFGRMSKDRDELIGSCATIVWEVHEILALFAPCVMGHLLSTDVQELQETLNSKLRDYNLSKQDRRSVRCFLALTEERGLSLNLFGFIDFDIVMPLKFVSLLFTYLIILLQFNKIIGVN